MARTKMNMTVESVEANSKKRKQTALVQVEPRPKAKKLDVGVKRSQSKERVIDKANKRYLFKGTSTIWSFGKGFSMYADKRDPFNKMVVCETCVAEGNEIRAEVRCRDSSLTLSTGNVMRHLQHAHKDSWESILVAQKTKVSVTSVKSKDIRNMFPNVPLKKQALQRLIVNRNLSFDIVEDSDFRGFCRALSPSYKFQSARGIVDDLTMLMMSKRWKNSTYFDTLGWWRDNRGKFPYLAALARLVLAVPATSAPSERLFSVAGLVATKLRACMDSDNIAMLVFLKSVYTFEKRYRITL